MNDNEFTKLSMYCKEHFDTVDQRLNEVSTKNDISLFAGAKSMHTTPLNSTFITEMAKMHRKIDHLERMIDYLADKAGVSKRVLETL